MYRRGIFAALLALAAGAAAFAQGSASDRLPPKPPAPGQEQPKPGPGKERPPIGQDQTADGGYSIEQSISDKAQLSTIAFSGLAFMTGTFGADTFLPPGKAADYFGFQYLRDIDAAEAGHNQMFLTNIGNNVLALLSADQEARFLALAKEQAPLYQSLAEKRLVLIKAFRQNLEGSAPAGSTGLSEAAVKAYVADIFAIDGTLSFRRAEVYGAVAAALTAAQKAGLAKLQFGDSSTWPELPDQYDKRTMSHEEDVLFLTYASEFFSWYAGSVDADVYFCPERHATYFEGFYMKDYPAMGNRDYFIPTALTGDSGEAFLAILTEAQRVEVVGIMDTLPATLRRIVDLRRTVSTELREFLAGAIADRDLVLRLSREYGELDGEISWQCATRFAAACRTLTAAQKAALVKLRNQDVFPKGAYLYSTEVAAPVIADTAFLFAAPPGGAQQPAASGSLGLRTLLGAPTASGIVLSTAFDGPARWFYRYGTSPDALGSRTAEQTTAGGKAEVETLAGLAPATAYWYRLVTAAGDGWTEGPLGRFVTQRPPGASFTCVIEADPHLDENSSAAVYGKVLGLMAKDLPDFAIDLGDASMAEKLASTAAGYEERNRLVRSFWDDIGGSVPFLMVLGNHDGEHGWAPTGGKPASDAAAAIRRAWFANPVSGPGSIYAGIGDTAYAFTWGDALFVVLDPYTWTPRKSPTDNWAWTLGRAQYDWLAATLAATTARYRFAFIHHLVGGMGKDTRGGADWAPYFEWGGRELDGTDGFAARRPGWGLPIHDLLVRGKVDVVFHGHDHFYAREQRDGIVYLEVPQPSAAREVDTARSAADYGYSTGTFFSSPGYLRLSVSPARAAIELVRGTGGAVADAVIISP